MRLQLKKPIVFLDVESTGLSVTQDRMVEISIIKVQPNGMEETKTWRMNPGIPIPANITQIIGIADKDVEDKPPFKQVAHEINNFIGSADIGGFNPFKLDIPLLMEELGRCGIDFDVSKRKIIDVQRIFHMMEQRNLAAAYQFYCGKNLDNHHSAEDDTRATYEVFQAQLEKYSQLGTEVEQICSVAGNPNGKSVDIAGRMVLNDKDEEVFNFGKYKGQRVTDVLKKDPAYYSWMMNGDFPTHTKKKLTEIRLRMKN